jgi:hypothetical protein
MNTDTDAAEANNTPVGKFDEPIECSKVRKCGWKGMQSDLVGVPHKKWKNATQLVCPKCGCDSYYKRDVK